MLGRVYEYFLSKFASAEGKNGGEFYTPSCIVRTLVSMIEPYKGIVYDQRTPIMIQILNSIFERKHLFIMEI